MYVVCIIHGMRLSHVPISSTLPSPVSFPPFPSLPSVKEEIKSCQAALQQVREETDTCRGELAVRNLKMVDQEVEVKLLAMKRSILEEQRNTLLERNQILAADLVCGVHNSSHSN